MNKNSNSIFSKDAFQSSLRGRFISAIEMGLLMAVLCMFGVLVIPFLIPVALEGKEWASGVDNLLGGGVGGFLIGSLLFGCAGGHFLFSFRLFPPSNETVRQYIHKRYKKLEDQIKWRNEGLQKMKQELAKLSS